VPEYGDVGFNLIVLPALHRHLDGLHPLSPSRGKFLPGAESNSLGKPRMRDRFLQLIAITHESRPSNRSPWLRIGSIRASLEKSCRAFNLLNYLVGAGVAGKLELLDRVLLLPQD
jgi:hypothetical protein